jgi:spore maturation protein CgeB
MSSGLWPRAETLPMIASHRGSGSPIGKAARGAVPYRVATITDEFTHNSFATEFQAIPVEPDNWRHLFEAHDPQILLCESAWTGLDLVRKPWVSGIHASTAPTAKHEVLQEIVAHCRRTGVPTVFWNKEDPTFYGNQRWDFARTSRLFDFVFTTAEECVARYRADHGVEAAVLPFAANHHLFNPVETAARSSRIVFAGSWYPRFARRSEEMATIIDRLVDQGFDLDIVARFHGPDDPLNAWPAKYQRFLRPSVPHARMPEIYKSSRFGLNINTVVDSRSMFARRVFELMACNTLVVSNHSRGIEELFGDLVVFADREPGRLSELSDQDIDGLRHQALHRVLKHHTYAVRWRQILQSIGLPAPASDMSASWICPVDTPDQADGAVRRFTDQRRSGALAGLLLLLGPRLQPRDLHTLVSSADGPPIAAVPIESPREVILDCLDRQGSDCFLFAEVAALPSPQWLENALCHLGYMHDHAVAPARDTKYVFVERQPGSPLLGHRQNLPEFLRNRGSPSAMVFAI